MKKKVILSLVIFLVVMIIANTVKGERIKRFERELYQTRAISTFSTTDNEEIPSDWFNLDLSQTSELSLKVENEVDNPIKGDINKDGYITSDDAKKVLRYAAGYTEEIDNTDNRLDIDGDGKITAVDARKVLQLDAAIYTEDMNDSLISNSLISSFGESIYTCNRLSVSNTLTLIPNKANNDMELEVVSSNSEIASVEINEESRKIIVTPKSMGVVRIMARYKNDTDVATYITLCVTDDIMIKAEDNTIINPLKGDINRDRIITVYDARMLLKYVAGLTEGIDNTDNRLDINGNENITAVDARKLLQLYNYIEDPKAGDLENLTQYFGEGIDDKYNTIYIGDVLNLECINEDAQKLEEGVTWTSTNTNILKVENGIVTAVGEGKATITAVTQDGYAGSVTIQVKNFTLEDSNIYIKADSDTTNPQKGDINKDGIITEYDARMLLEYTAGLTEGIDNTDNRLDMNGDGEITAVDARKLLQLNTFIKNPNTEQIENLSKYFGEGIEDNFNRLNLEDTLTLQVINKEGEQIEGEINWASTDTNVLTVENGVITAKGKGKSTISATVNNTVIVTATFTVGDKVLSNIEVKTNPNKTSYIIGEELNTTGLSLLLTYDNGRTEEITSGFTCTPTTLNTEGEQEITVVYGEKTTTFKVIVNPITLEEIEIILPPTKVEYIEGENFDKNGLSIIKVYNDKSEFEINNYTITNEDNLKAGQKSVTISYTEEGVTKTTEQEITVEEKELRSIEITSMPAKTTYIEGQNFDKTGMVVTAIYNNGSRKEITEYTVTNGEELKAGQESVTISYEEKGIIKTAEQAIIVEEKELRSIEITSMPAKTTYIEGENFDRTGMVVTAIYNNGSRKEITEYTVTNGENLKAGQSSVTISYTEEGITKTAEQAITVTEKLKIVIKEYEESKKGEINYISKINPDTTIVNAIKNIETNGEIEIYKGEEKITSENTELATGMEIIITLNSEEVRYVVVVTGDVNGDSTSDFRDILQVNKHRLGTITLEEPYRAAGDVNEDGKVDFKDILQINKYRLGTISSF